MKKTTKIAALLLSFSLCLCACGAPLPETDSTASGSTVSIDNNEASVSVSDTNVTETSSNEVIVSVPSSGTSTNTSKAEEIAAKRRAYMLDSSLQSTGNNYRLKKVIEKARNGETVNMAALGGSITEGAGAKTFHEGYAYIFANAFKEAFCSGDNLNYVNAGLSGTPSGLGALRYEKDVVDVLGCNPDLLIIEFAVNDYNEITGGRALESLIYQALTANEECAVILLFSVSEGKWSASEEMSPTGKYYGIPMVNMKRALLTGVVSDKDYFYDEYHPAPYGHQLTSDCLMYLLNTVDEKELDAPFEIPTEAFKGRDFVNMKLATAENKDVKITLGSFSATDSQVQTMAFKNTLSFSENFMHKSGSGNDPLKFKVKASHILLCYKTSSSTAYGEADIYVDGKKVTTLNGYSSGGWNNCNVDIVLDDTEVKSHTIEIKMAKGSEDKNFTLLALSYSK